MFDPVLPVWLVTVLLTALLIYSVIIEWRRPLRFLVLRLVSCAIAVASLAFMMLRPSIKDATKGEAVLLTPGFSERIADSLRRAFPRATFYHLGERGIKNSVRLSSYRDLFNNDHAVNAHLGDNHALNDRAPVNHAEINDNGSSQTPSGNITASGNLIAIVGEGLPAYALDSIPGGFQYFPSEEIDGITSIELPSQKLTTHEVATISGTYRSSHAEGTRNAGSTLYLSGPAGKIDSLKLVAPRGNFSFVFTPRTAGGVTYTLSIRGPQQNLLPANGSQQHSLPANDSQQRSPEANDSVQHAQAGTDSERHTRPANDSSQNPINEAVPLFVEAFVPLSILVLQDFPTFEMQHLKNFLSDRGHKIAMRAQLSRNIVRTEFANRQAVPLNRLTVPLLDEFDILIVDPSTLSKLSLPEREVVETSLNHGLGMLAVYNGEPSKALPKELLPVTFSTMSSDTTSVFLHGRRYTLPATRFKPASTQAARPTIEAITISKDASRILSGYAPLRKGMAGFQLLRETYSILMAGDSVAYGQLWSPLLEAVARPGDVRESIRLRKEFPVYANEPLIVDLISGTTPALFADSSRISVAEDVLIDDVWHATVWEERKGWHEMRTAEDTLSYYVFGDNDWRALRVSELKRATYRASQFPEPATNRRAEKRPVSLTPFFIVFLLAVGFLWLAPKL